MNGVFEGIYIYVYNWRYDWIKSKKYIDVAGDMIGVYEWNVTDYATQWFIPTQDLINIYQVRTIYLDIIEIQGALRPSY